MKSLLVNQHTSLVNSSFAELDNIVAQSPWQSQVVNEMAIDSEQHEQLSILAPTLAKLSQQGRWIVLVGASKQSINYINQMAGLDSARVLLVHPKDQTDGLWAIEQALMSGNSSAVLGWPGEINSRDLKRLQLASKRTSALAFVFNRLSNATPEVKLSYQSKQQPMQPYNQSGSFH